MAVLVTVNQVLVAVLMALRVYALYGCSSRVLGSMVIIEAANVSIWALFVGQEPTVSQSTFGCQIGLSYDASKRSLAAWVAMFAYDSIIFALTLMKHGEQHRVLKFAHGGCQ
ncbi:hypothetical protein BD779DRAFT_1678677 [Infundibulicybe gibba]|nr:hypothetical protein BD779DRAFT_1678677 [Infundibulicybe gibba]